MKIAITGIIQSLALMIVIFADRVGAEINDACTLLSSAEVSEIVGKHFEEGKQMRSNTNQNQISCAFLAKDLKHGTVGISYFKKTYMPGPERFKGFRDNAERVAKIEIIKGIGDESFIWTPMNLLYARKGEEIVAVQFTPPDAYSREVLVKLQKAVIGKLK